MQLPNPNYAHEQVYLKKYKMTKEIKVYKCQKSTSLIVIRQTSQDNQLLNYTTKVKHIPRQGLLVSGGRITSLVALITTSFCLSAKSTTR